MFCGFCGEPVSGSACQACGRPSAEYARERNAKELEAAIKRLESQSWPAYGFIGGFIATCVFVVVLGEGWPWSGWAPPELSDFALGASLLVFAFGIVYFIGILIDDNRLRNVEPGDPFRVSS